jgi:hypothetical protein
MKEKTLIRVPRGRTGELCKIFGKSAPTVRAILRGEREGNLASRVRLAAMRCGGVEYKVSGPDEELDF